MSYIDDLITSYGRFVALPWQQSVAPAQRVWMAIYPPKDERRLRLNVPAFEAETTKAKHPWALIDITTSFETWLAGHEYADAYFEDPELLDTALPTFLDTLVDHVQTELGKANDPNGVVGLLGAGTLFGLGDEVKVSALLNRINTAIAGRLLVFFPGQQERHVYRLLDARDGWDYHAIAITAEGATH